MIEMTNKKQKEGNVPNLRFLGFDEPWVKARLEDVTEKINSGKTPLGGESNYLIEGVLFIRSQNVNNDRLELENTVYISENVNATMKNSVVRANDILLNITGASLGRSCVVPEDFEIGNVNQHVCIIRTKKHYNPRFIQPILASARGQAIFESLQTGSGREGLNFESIKKIEIGFPSFPEQKKIANFFYLIDRRIQTQNKIIESLETLIRDVRNQIIKLQIRFKDKHGSNYPEWKLVQIGEVLKIGGGRDYKHLQFGSIPVFGTGGVMTFVDDYFYDGETVCIGRKGTIDKPLYHNGKIWTVDTLFYTHSFQSCIPKFIYHLFKTINWLEYNEASGVPSLSKTTIEKIGIHIPSIEEQNHIAIFLSKIDEKIQSEKGILKRMEKQKKYFLQRIFI